MSRGSTDFRVRGIIHQLLPSEARNPSFSLHSHRDGFLASLGKLRRMERLASVLFTKNLGQRCRQFRVRKPVARLFEFGRFYSLARKQ